MNFQNSVPLVAEKIEIVDIMNVLFAFKETNSNSLLLSSNGGLVQGFLKLSRYFIERNISVIGDGVVASLAAMLFFCGKFRVATPGTIFLIHEGCLMNGSGAEVKKGEAQMRALICRHENDIEGYRQWVNIWHSLEYIDKVEAELISKKTSLSIGMAMELMRAEHEFNVEDALKYGIIHDVVDKKQIHILPQFGRYEPW